MNDTRGNAFLSKQSPRIVVVLRSVVGFLVGYEVYTLYDVDGLWED